MVKLLIYSDKLTTVPFVVIYGSALQGKEGGEWLY